jgi:hypothetical protein
MGAAGAQYMAHCPVMTGGGAVHASQSTGTPDWGTAKDGYIRRAMRASQTPRTRP